MRWAYAELATPMLPDETTRPRKRLLTGILVTIVGFLLIAFLSLPKTLFDNPTAYVIEDRNGLLMSASIAADGQWRFPPSDSVPEAFRQCIIQFEDRRFQWHFGFDPLAFARAVRQNFQRNKIVSGASTITMQVVRMSRNRERTFLQKVIEVVQAVGLEVRYRKSAILKLYADNAPFGSNVVGLEAAAWRYFGRSPETLSWAESATLAVLPNAPSLIHPGKNREMLLAKRNGLLDRLAARKIITTELAELSKMEPLPDKPYPLPQHAPHLLEQFRKEHSTAQTRLRSTLDGTLQQGVMEILQRRHLPYRANGILNAAALVLDVDQSRTLAYVGNIWSSDPEAEPFVDMIRARRSPGSTLKPFLYAGLLTDGQILPHTLVPDVPTQIGGYTPQNFDLNYDGAVPASAALSRSLNIPAVRMLQQYRYPRFHHLLQQLGITTMDRSADHYGLSMVLGGGEVTMWELAGAYANLARTLKHYGVHRGLYNPMDYHAPTYRHITSADSDNGTHGLALQHASPLDYASLYFTFQAMNEVNRPESEALWEQFSSSRKIAWKTGTSFGFRDGWAVGLTPDYVVCVWVGNADGEGRPGLTGIQTAAPILFDIFGLLPTGAEAFEMPTDHMIQTKVCTQSGHLAGPYCAEPETRYVPASGFKSAVCPYCRLVHTNQAETHRVTRNCAAVSDFTTTSWFVLPPAMAHYYKARHPSYRELPPWQPGCEPTDGTVMEMIYPRNNAKIYIPLELDGKKGKVVFTAAHQHAGSTVYWHLNNEFMGETNDPHQLALTIAAGRHELILVDEAGNRLTRHIEILEKQN